MAINATQETIDNLYTAGKDQFEEAVKAGTEQIETIARNGVQTAQRGFEQGIEAAKKQLDDAIKGFDELATLSRENVEACLAASSVTAKAAQTVNGELYALSRKGWEAQLSAARALATVKSPSEFFDLQSSFFKDQYQNMVSEANKLATVATTAANDAFAPVNARFVAALDNMARAFTR